MSDHDGAAVARPTGDEEGDSGATHESANIGWVRAILSGVAILACAFGATVVAANAILTQVSGVSRNTRQYLASILFLVVVMTTAWALRRLQARGLI